MTKQEHAITPPPELLQQWAVEYWGNPGESIGEGERYIATKAARWGADQELEACVDYLCDYHTSWDENSHLVAGLRAARRPKQLSLKEQALEALAAIQAGEVVPRNGAQTNAIRRALEQLPNSD